MIEQGLFKRHFVGRDGFQWWIGQLPPEESWKNNISGNNQEPAKGFGERYRVRILGYHTANADDIPDEELPWAYVMYPVTAGGGGRGSSQSANLTQGTFVFGFFMDGEDAQLPIIMGVLGYNDYNAVMKNVTPTRFIPFDGYPMNDEVMGQERSTTQVNDGDAQQVATQENATGQPVNNEYTSSAQGNTSTFIKADAKNNEEPPIPLSQTSECEKSPMGDVQRVLMNVMNEIHSFNQLLYDARGAISAGVADVQRYIENAINKVTGKISAALKWVFTEMEKFILKQINNLSKLSYSLVFPDLREPLNAAMGAANDAIVCIIRNLINELPGMVGGFIGDIAGLIQNPPSGNNLLNALPSPTKLVNVPRCFVEDFMATTMGNITGLMTNAINDTLGAIDSITGGVTELIGDVMGFVEDLISFLTCGGMADVECPKVNEWSILSGPGSKGGASNIQSMLGKVKDIGSKAQGVADSVTGAVDNITSLGEIDFTDVLATSGACGDLMGPRTCGTPTVEYIGDGRGAEINLVVSAAGEVLAGDVISAGIGFAKGKSYLKVYDDCGIGQGAVIKPVFGPVVGVPDEDFTSPNVDPNTGLPLVNPGVNDDGFPLGTPGTVTLPDGSVIAPGIGTAKPPFVPAELYVDPETGRYTTDPKQGNVVGVNPQTGEPLYIPGPKTGRPGEKPVENVGKPLKTQSGLPGESVEVCRIVEFRLERSSSPDSAPIQVTFTLVGDPPNFGGDTSFSFLVDQAGTTQRTPCVYPNRDYLVTATTFRVPDTDRFREVIEQGWSPDDPTNIKLRITRGLQKADAGGEEAEFGDYPNQTDRPAIQEGNGIWADYKDTLSGRPGRPLPGDYNLGSSGIRDFQIYPNKGVFKEVNENSDNTVLFRYNAEILPAIPLPPELPPEGIVDVIVINPGYDYLPAPDGSEGGDGAVWAPPDYTIIIGNPGDGTTDYYPPVPPGNNVGIPTNGTVTTPVNSNPTDVVDPGGNLIEVLPGVPTPIPDGGRITTPTIGGSPGYEAIEPNVGVYPPDNVNNGGDGGQVVWKPINTNGPLWNPNTGYRPGNIVSVGPLGTSGYRGSYPSTDSYPVILYLCELIVDQSGMRYSPEDEIVIEPDMGATAVPKFDNFGRLLSIKVTAGGEGFTTRPKVYIRTQTGFGANIIPKFCIDRVGINDLERNPTLQDKVVTVINCVGKF